MYQITGYTIDKSIQREFECLFDAIEFRDQLDALYYRVVWKEYNSPPQKNSDLFYSISL